MLQGNAEVGMEDLNVQNQNSGIAVSLGKSVDQVTGNMIHLFEVWL